MDVFDGITKAQKTFNLDEFINASRGLVGSMKLDDAIQGLKRLGVEGDNLKVILSKMGFEATEVGDALAKSGKSGLSFTTKLKNGFDGLARSIGLTSKSLLGWIGGITAVVAAFTFWKNHIEETKQHLLECVSAADEAAESWNKQQETLSGQVSRLEEIQEQLENGNLTEEESYAIKSELYSIQQNLVTTYGEYASAIDLVNGKLDTEIQKVKELTAAEAQRQWNENYEGIQESIKQMETEKSYSLGKIRSYQLLGDDAKAIQRVLEKYEDVIKEIPNGDYSAYEFSFVGTPDEAQDKLNEILTDLQAEAKSFEDSKIFDSFIKGASQQLGVAKNLQETYKDTYEWQKQLVLLKDTEGYDYDNESKTAVNWLSDLETAVNDYNEALISGDPSKISEAAEKFNQVKNAVDGATDSAGNSIMSLYGDQAEDITDKLNKAAIAAHEFKSAVSGDNSVFGKDVRHYAYQLKNLGLDDIDLKDMLKTDEVDEVGERQFRALMDAAYECGLISGKTVEDIQPLIDILIELGYVAGETASQTQDANEKMVSSYDDAVKSVSDLKSELGVINGAISEQGYSGNLSVDTYDSLIAISKDYAACVEYQNGALQLNAEKANMLFEAKSELQKAEIELKKITEAAKWKENADEIARLTKEYDGLDETIAAKIKSLEKENDGIEANLIGYDLQIAAIEELTSAYGRWKAVSESDNSDSMYKDIQKAYEAIKDAQKTGQTGVGNVVYQAAVELLVPEEEDVSKYMSTLKRYITDGSNGLNNFVTDMVTEGLMTKTGDHVEMVAGTTIEEICQRMTITPDMAKAIFNALEMYDFDFHWTDEDFNINTDDAMAELKAAQEEMNKTIAKINEMKETGATIDLATGLSLDDLEKKYAEQKEQVDKLMSSATGGSEENTVEYTVTANTESAEEALGTIKDKLDEIKAKIEELAQKIIGTFGAFSTLSILGSVYDRLVDINNYKIADKSFTTYNYVKTVGGSSDGADGALPLASGTKSAPDGVALLGDEYSPDGSPKPELVITDGAAYVAGQSGPEFVNLNEGDRVIPADETEKILRGNSKAERGVVPAFATGAGGYPAGSVQEDKYLEGVIGPDPAWLKQREEQKKKDDELIKQLSAKAAEKSADDTYLNNNAALNTNSTKKTYLNTSVTVGGGGNSSSLKNSGGSGGGSGGSSSSNSSDSSKKEKSQFEKDYEYHQHLLAMEKEDYETYIKWLDQAYKDAYAKGQIELEDFYKYEVEVFEGRKELFQDSIEDIEHKIKGLERDPGNEAQIINYYNQIIQKIDNELAAARARGLNDDDDYVQELLEQKWDYADEIKDIQDEITENAKDAVEDLVDYRIDMLKQDLENERDAISDKLDTLRDFYDKQKEMLQDVYDEEKYLEEQSEKRKSVDDIKAEIDMLRFDDSAKAQKRIKELQEELKDAEKELSDFEKDHALENATDLLDKMYEQQESQMQSEMDALEEKLNDPKALYNQALRDIQNNTLALYEEMIKYNNKYGSGNAEDIYTMWDEADKSLDAYFKTMGESYKNILLADAYKPTGYASGTSHATPGIHELFEGNKDEYVYTTKDGKKYRMFSGLGDKVLNASATDFLYKFANNGETFISNMLSGLVGAIGNVGKPAQQVQLSTGDIIIQGNATQETVSAIRRAQRENVDYILREFTRLNR